MSPPLSLTDFDEHGLRDLSALTEAEREVYVAVEREGKAVLSARARRTVAPVPSAMLERARLRLDDREEEMANTW